MILRALLIALIAVLAGTGLADAAKLSTADAAWIAKCMDQLKAERASKTSMRRYCVCMHDYFDDNADVTQSDMEHMFPPAHRQCYRQAGWR